MRRLISVAVIVSLLFCACGRTETATEESEVTIYTTEATVATTTEATTTTEAATTEATTVTEATTTVATTEEEPEPEVISISFPDEFFTKLQEIFDRYGINQNCDGDEENCTCDIYNETTDEEGNVTREKVASIYYMDLETGYSFEINSGVHYPVASCVKIPFVVYLYEKIAAGEIDGETVLTYEKRHYMGGTGIIQNGEVGDQYTVMELLELSIIRSDNIAFEMLKDLVDWDEFAGYCEEYGCTHTEDTRLTQEKICTESAGAYARILAQFLESDNPYVETFKSHLAITRIPMIKSSYTIYRKYGWSQYAFHDIAYIEAEHPYVLAILTNLEGEENSDYSFYEEVSYLIEEYSVAAWAELSENSADNT
ncbi:MAG: class A beta-lactamase-related serine hydrolase [Oscillospiraceae bacterium]|nr:class A beta-lactamase-related serine hydrolase [Oscillospiraceae bacterium]